MYAITLFDIAIAFIPVLVTLVIIFFWSSNIKQASVAILRMLVQLLLIGYALEFIFNADNPWIILGGGSRSMKVKVPPQALVELGGEVVADLATPTG